MSALTRVKTFRSFEIPVAAPDYWAMLLDWAAIMKWMPKVNPPAPLLKVETKPGHSLGRLPCTRDCYFDPSGVPAGMDPESIPKCVGETLLYVDDAARFIYYNIDPAGQSPFGLRNYLATTEVDELGPTRTRVTCSGRFDIPVDAPAEMCKALIEGVYEFGIIKGISDTLQRGIGVGDRPIAWR